MPSISETGHAKNVANFLDLITFCKGYGGNYNPSKTAIQIAQLDALYNDAKNSVTEVTNQNTAFNNVVNARVNLFKDNKQLATRLTNAFDTTDASDEAKNNVKSFNRKLQGKRASKAPSPLQKAGGEVTPADLNTPAPKTISSSQQSYDQQIEHLSGLVSALASEPSYKPNETGLQVGTINKLIDNQTKSNADVATAYTAVSNARITRDKYLYDKKKGLYDTSLEVKKYVKSVFGTTSPEYKQVNGIKFSERKA